jgi:hypothetical protein
MRRKLSSSRLLMQPLNWLSVEAENRDDLREFMKSHLLALRFRHLNDTFHTDTACCKVTSVRGHTCFQVYAGVESAAVYACPMKRKFHATNSLKDFCRNVGAPRNSRLTMLVRRVMRIGAMHVVNESSRLSSLHRKHLGRISRRDGFRIYNVALDGFDRKQDSTYGTGAIASASVR